MLRKILSLPDISNWCSERPTGNGFYYHVRYVLYLIKLGYYTKKMEKLRSFIFYSAYRYKTKNSNILEQYILE